jgi:hypothetical protein
MIFEAVITTRNPDAGIHIVPLGYREEHGEIILAPFRPSTTLNNLERTRQAVVSTTDDVTVIAGCLTGRWDWPTTPTVTVDGVRLRDALAHMELEVKRVDDDPARPRLSCAVRHRETHRPFRGFNRAQAACVEAAILVSRLHLLPPDKVDNDIAYLQIAIDKTAGERERQAWDWLMAAVRDYRTRGSEGRV